MEMHNEYRALIPRNSHDSWSESVWTDEFLTMDALERHLERWAKLPRGLEGVTYYVRTVSHWEKI